MAIGLIADEGSVFVEKEVTEGTYVAESAGASAIEVLADGLEFTEAKELLARNNRTSTVETVASRVGQKSISGTIPTEFKAGSTEGAAPETSPLYEALLGGLRTGTASTSLTGHSTTEIFLSAGDVVKYAVGDIVKIKEYDLNPANSDHVSPIVAVETGVGIESITLLVPYGSAFSDNVVIAPFVTYFHQSGAPTLSVTEYLGGEIRRKLSGMRCVSGELANFATGQLPEMSFGLEGLNFAREVGAPLFTPVYDSSLPPVTLCAQVFQDGVEITVNNVGFTLTNTLGFLTSTASCNGKIASRITKLEVAGQFNPYMDDSQVDNFNLFDQNTAFSLFGSAHNEGAALNEWLNNVCYYFPNCRVPELGVGNEDGVLTDIMNFSAHKNLGNDTVFIGFV